MKLAFLVEPPFNYRREDGTVTGCDVELARSVLAMVGMPELELIETEFAQLIPGVADGRWRMTTGLFVTEGRRRIVAFSRPIWALPDGLLVRGGNPKRLTGYAAVVQASDCRLAVIRDQIQHQSARDFGVPEHRILVCETYDDAAQAVLVGRADAYASVARAHSGFLQRNPALALEVVSVPRAEKEAAFGAFAFNKSDDELRTAVDGALRLYLGTDQHRAMMRRFGFASAEVALVAAEAG